MKVSFQACRQIYALGQSKSFGLRIWSTPLTIGSFILMAATAS
jgi:hypothetical protein